MEQIGECAKLLLEEVERARVESEQRLDGDSPVAFAIVGFVDGAHPAAPDEAKHLVPRGALPRR